MRSILALALLLAHPLHTTHTDLIESDGQVIVQVRAFTDDLRSAVEKKEGAVNDSTLTRYLQGSITLADSAGRATSLVFLGKEIQGDITITRLRAVSLSHLAGARVSQRMHMELFSDQVNVVQASYAGRRYSLLFVPGDNPKPLP
jgi:hypothetical protein